MKIKNKLAVIKPPMISYFGKNNKAIIKPLTCKFIIYGDFFAIHHQIIGIQKYDKKLWGVTHIPSGLSIVKYKKTRKECKGVLNSLLQIKEINWSEKIQKPTDEIRKQIREIINGHHRTSFQEMLKNRYEGVDK